MATITIKDLPDELYQQLKTSAARNRRSINREAIVCLERALQGGRPAPGEFLARARRVRESVAVYVTDAELARARSEGRS